MQGGGLAGNALRTDGEGAGFEGIPSEPGPKKVEAEEEEGGGLPEPERETVCFPMRSGVFGVRQRGRNRFPEGGARWDRVGLGLDPGREVLTDEAQLVGGLGIFGELLFEGFSFGD